MDDEIELLHMSYNNGKIQWAMHDSGGHILKSI